MPQEVHQSPALQISLASHKPLTSGVTAGASSLAQPQASVSAVAPRPLPVADVHEVVEAREVIEVADSSEVIEATAPIPVEVRELLNLHMSPDDGRVSVALQRYLSDQGWQLAWEIDRDFPIEYPATFRGDFLGIVEQIVVSLQNTDAPIRVKVYEANRVLRVVHATQ
ncbi:MAG: toxin co-regulated pilus biosynthesis Q family protein [Pandoraea sp.]|nr:toxin co-regulated pilus biosynthesis Q family protein [Pandoraea sp.]MDR3397880.1 toxin co-regulated pilus biosynthesis Q family protein [Pandoraea sp.]